MNNFDENHYNRLCISVVSDKKLNPNSKQILQEIFLYIQSCLIENKYESVKELLPYIEEKINTFDPTDSSKENLELLSFITRDLDMLKMKIIS